MVMSRDYLSCILVLSKNTSHQAQMLRALVNKVVRGLQRLVSGSIKGCSLATVPGVTSLKLLE